MEKFLIIAETENCGYFVEIHDDLATASEREKLFFHLAFDPPTDHEKLNEEFTSMGNYIINDQHAVFFDIVGITSNGNYTTYVLKIDDDFSFEYFSLLRYSSRKIIFKDPQKEHGYLEYKYGENILDYGWAN